VGHKLPQQVVKQQQAVAAAQNHMMHGQAHQYKQQPVSHMMYDESLNPVVVFNNNHVDGAGYAPATTTGHFQQQFNRPAGLKTQQQQQQFRSNSQDEYVHRFCAASSSDPNQQIWVPREEAGGCGGETDHMVMTDESAAAAANMADLSLEDDPTAFTIKRHLIQLQEEQKQVDVLKKIIEQKLKVQLPQVASVEELGVALADGVILCHLMNQIFPRAIQIIHVPSLALV
jgi:hypothetical protein